MTDKYTESYVLFSHLIHTAVLHHRLLLLLLKSVELDDDVALLLSVAGLVMGPHVTSESSLLLAARRMRGPFSLVDLCVTCTVEVIAYTVHMDLRHVRYFRHRKSIALSTKLVVDGQAC